MISTTIGWTPIKGNGKGKGNFAHYRPCGVHTTMVTKATMLEKCNAKLVEYSFKLDTDIHTRFMY